MSFRARLERVHRGFGDSDELAELAGDALEQGEEEAAVPIVRAAAEKHRDARLWQWAGLLYRALDEHGQAIECLAMAGGLAPADARIAHAQAHVALEAGVEAEALFERARGLAPDNGAVLIGLTSARMAAGHGVRALNDLEAILEQAPLWIDGHLQYAQLNALLGRHSAASASLERAIIKLPREPALWLARCDLNLRREAYQDLLDVVGRAAAAGVAGDDLDFYRAVAAGEVSDPGADGLLSDSAAVANPALAVWRTRHLLRHGRISESISLIDRELRSERRQAIWPYAAIAWRLAGDPRSEWLEEQPGLVSVVDLSKELAPMTPLELRLTALHERSGQFIDQSVRGGSQTDGPLLSRIEPEIRDLRAAVTGAVSRYVADLPAPDPDHPLLGFPRDRRIRFSGSWSVRLRGRGHHANHVHPMGWISSALYISVPDPRPDDAPDSASLILGEPDARLGLDMGPRAMIPPRPGQLVLFPSWMWHGTRPFAEGQRLSVAFDVAPPR